MKRKKLPNKLSQMISKGRGPDEDPRKFQLKFSALSQWSGLSLADSIPKYCAAYGRNTTSEYENGERSLSKFFEDVLIPSFTETWKWWLEHKSEEIFKCSKCKKYLPRIAFHVDTSRPGNVSSYCKECKKIQHKNRKGSK